MSGMYSEKTRLGGELFPTEHVDDNFIPISIEDGQIQYKKTEKAKLKELTKMKRIRKKTLKMVENLYVRLVGILLVFIDITIVLIDIIVDPKEKVGMEIYDIISVLIWCYFFIEISLRIFGKGKPFFKNPFDLLDLFIVALTGSVTVVYVVADFTGSNSDLGKLVVVFRFMRVFLFCRIISERRHVSKASRRLVSENKRRYQKDGFDLDLTYITDRVIASSFPSAGSQSIYRNAIDEVGRFLDTKHPENYKIYNMCSERHYDESFFHFRVKRLMIDDHNVPKLTELLDFLDDIRTWVEADPDHIIVIHCKGGKGRTGLAVCAWLLESDTFKSADDALEYFGRRRTDYSEGDKFQGVETPSQARYVNYFEQIKFKMGRVIPKPKVLKLQSLRILNLGGLGKGDGRDIGMEVVTDGTTVFGCTLGRNMNCQAVYDRDIDGCVVRLINGPVVSGDVKIRFKSSSRFVPKAYDNCAFFFWFNTGFIRGNRLYLERNELDNPHKMKPGKVYSDNFAVEVTFINIEESMA
ncbi:phosphatidylinositol 3,4,5-trisphosphate 3-phosphatase TPTE2-like [Amphiura filiformis]|uniref:phosphatidylinositol 3,4,5-trisphosphate 3-phosphatase TPTE2-like n=1 Tax=Amphiura filiformis TaxID=82378 RepID=UPI003B21EA62